MADFIDELERLRQLRLERVLTDAEFARAKEKLLGGAPPPEESAPSPGHYWDAERVRRVEPMGNLDWTEIDALLQQNKKIQAIKVYRLLTGKGLREAKAAVEQRQSIFR